MVTTEDGIMNINRNKYLLSAKKEVRMKQSRSNCKGEERGVKQETGLALPNRCCLHIYFTNSGRFGSFGCSVKSVHPNKAEPLIYPGFC